MSFLKGFLSQTAAPLGTLDRQAALHKGGWPCPVRELLFDTRQRTARQPCLLDGTPRELLKRP